MTGAAPRIDPAQAPDPAQARLVRQALLQKVCGDAEMFALGSSVARVVQMASSDDHGTNDLAHYVLSDTALTQRILRLANTARYRTMSGAPVTTVSRAISLLGFDNVKATALALLLVDALADRAHAHSVRLELEAALCASLVGRELARRSHYQDAEEASVAALFRNLGPLLVACHEYERYTEICELAASGGFTPAQASRMILGCSYEALTEAVLAEWKIPDVIARALAPLPAGVLKPAAYRGDWMRQVASFAQDAAQLLASDASPAGTPRARELLSRYGGALDLGSAYLSQLFEVVKEEMATMLHELDVHQPERADQPAPAPQQASGALPDFLQLAAMGAAPDTGCWPSGKPRNARELLLADVQDLTHMRATGRAKVNDLILAVLESLSRSMGFRFATIALRDTLAMQYRARLSIGDDFGVLQDGFRFALEPANDIFHLAMQNDTDLEIGDSSAARVRELLPAWHRRLLPDARSFIVLPLVAGGVRAGLFYADRAEPAPEGVPADEAALLRALKSQVLAAL